MRLDLAESSCVAARARLVFPGASWPQVLDAILRAARAARWVVRQPHAAAPSAGEFIVLQPPSGATGAGITFHIALASRYRVRRRGTLVRSTDETPRHAEVIVARGSGSSRRGLHSATRRQLAQLRPLLATVRLSRGRLVYRVETLAATDRRRAPVPPTCLVRRARRATTRLEDLDHFLFEADSVSWPHDRSPWTLFYDFCAECARRPPAPTPDEFGRILLSRGAPRAAVERLVTVYLHVAGALLRSDRGTAAIAPPWSPLPRSPLRRPAH